MPDLCMEESILDTLLSYQIEFDSSRLAIIFSYFFIARLNCPQTNVLEPTIHDKRRTVPGLEIFVFYNCLF